VGLIFHLHISRRKANAVQVYFIFIFYIRKAVTAANTCRLGGPSSQLLACVCSTSRLIDIDIHHGPCFHKLLQLIAFTNLIMENADWKTSERSSMEIVESALSQSQKQRASFK